VRSGLSSIHCAIDSFAAWSSFDGLCPRTLADETSPVLAYLLNMLCPVLTGIPNVLETEDTEIKAFDWTYWMKRRRTSCEMGCRLTGLLSTGGFVDALVDGLPSAMWRSSICNNKFYFQHTCCCSANAEIKLSICQRGPCLPMSNGRISTEQPFYF
jgi:hypothetical protein